MYNRKLKISTIFIIQNTFTTLDTDFFQQLGGVENNSLINILEIDDSDDIIKQTHIICHLSFYDFEILT